MLLSKLIYTRAIISNIAMLKPKDIRKYFRLFSARRNVKRKEDIADLRTAFLTDPFL